MYYIKQDDYDNFQCIAAACPKSCCKCWQIVIDEDALERYENAEGDFSARLKAGVDFEEGVFLQNNGDCSMLGEGGLCDLQCAMGEEALCYTCRLYPRHIEEFEDVREFSLSLSCPEAARMAIERIKPMSFLESETDEEDDFEDFDYLMYTKLVDARERIFKIAGNRKISIWARIENILFLSGELQKCVNEDRLFDMDETTDKYVVNEKYGHTIDKDISVLFALERLNKDWQKTLEETTDIELETVTEREEVALEQILVLLIYTYFCGAVYDDEIYSKAALCCYSIVWIFIIYKSKVHGEDLNVLTEVLYSYAREVEHSDLNLDALEEHFQN